MDGIFLHTAWRSSGTWLWEQLRNTPGYHGFYEPLHEFLPTMDTRIMATLSPCAWASRHPETAQPYFKEFLPLHDGKGVRGANISFSFDNYFGQPPEDLRAYINSLCATAAQGSKRPVLKFARSQGRLPWFVENFPNHLHAALIRQPWTQFRSGWRCLAEDKNPYFLAAPCLVLERNFAHPAVAALIKALNLPIQPAPGANVIRRLKYWIRAARLIPAATLYRAHIAVWLLSTLATLPAAELVLDGDANPVKTAAKFGLAYESSPRPPVSPSPMPEALHAADIIAAHDAALAAIAAHLTPALCTQLDPWLNAAETTAARDLATKLRAAQPAPWRRAAWGLQAHLAGWVV
jgi:hypothetical protein